MKNANALRRQLQRVLMFRLHTLPRFMQRLSIQLIARWVSKITAIQLIGQLQYRFVTPLSHIAENCGNALV
jgi:hypothetical protein